MSDQKIIHFKKPKKLGRKNKKMLFLVVLIGAFLGLALWNYFVADTANLDVQIPESKNINFNQTLPLAMTANQVAIEFEQADGKPILLYIYTSWCKICTKNFPVINEIAREFQNTELRIMALSIDRNQQSETLQAYLNKFGDVYFAPRFLVSKDGFLEFLQKKNIRYSNHIPFTVLLSRDGEVVAKFSGMKSKNYLRNKIIRELYF
jgi:peroxiredoxin